LAGYLEFSSIPLSRGSSTSPSVLQLGLGSCAGFGGRKHCAKTLDGNLSWDHTVACQSVTVTAFIAGLFLCFFQVLEATSASAFCRHAVIARCSLFPWHCNQFTSFGMDYHREGFLHLLAGNIDDGMGNANAWKKTSFIIGVGGNLWLY